MRSAHPRIVEHAVVLMLLAAALCQGRPALAAGAPGKTNLPDTATTVRDSLARDTLGRAGPPLVFERCPADTNLGCNPASIPARDSTLFAPTVCGPAAIHCDSSDSVSGRVRTRTLRYRATDGCGHTALCTQRIIWTVDTVSPLLPTFRDTTLAHDTGRCRASLDLPARALKAGSDSVAISYAPPAPFPVGTTVVVATAGDSCAGVARDSFTVTVKTEICGAKFYDANGNGVNDDRGEMAGWAVTLIGTDARGAVGPLTVQTTPDGRYCFGDLLPGSYAVTARRTAGTIGSEPDTTYLPKLGAEGACPAIADFGEFCIGPSGGAPMSAWGGTPAQKILNDRGGPIAELEELAALCLRNPDGTEFKPTTLAKYRSWLQVGGKTNMAYALSVQLSMLHLNVEAGLVSGAAIVSAAGCGNRGPVGASILVNDLLAVANAELCVRGYTPEGDPARAKQACLAAALELANSDRGFLQKQPCPAASPMDPRPGTGAVR